MIVTAIIALPTGFCSRFPFSNMTKAKQKGGSRRVVTGPRTKVTTHPSGATLITAFRRDDCQAKVFVNPIRSCEDHLVWLSFSIEPIDDDDIGPSIFERSSLRAVRRLVRDVENLVSDIEEEIDLYGRTVDDVVADIRKAGIVSR